MTVIYWERLITIRCYVSTTKHQKTGTPKYVYLFVWVPSSLVVTMPSRPNLLIYLPQHCIAIHTQLGLVHTGLVRILGFDIVHTRPGLPNIRKRNAYVWIPCEGTHTHINVWGTQIEWIIKRRLRRRWGQRQKEWDINKQEYASHCVLKFCHRLCLDGPVTLFIFWKMYTFTAHADLETFANTFVKVWDDSPHDIVQTTYVTIWIWFKELWDANDMHNDIIHYELHGSSQKP